MSMLGGAGHGPFDRRVFECDEFVRAKLAATAAIKVGLRGGS